MPMARPLLKYDPLKTRIITPGGDLPASRITDPTPITLSVKFERSKEHQFIWRNWRSRTMWTIIDSTRNSQKKTRSVNIATSFHSSSARWRSRLSRNRFWSVTTSSTFGLLSSPVSLLPHLHRSSDLIISNDASFPFLSPLASSACCVISFLLSITTSGFSIALSPAVEFFDVAVVEVIGNVHWSWPLQVVGKP